MTRKPEKRSPSSSPLRKGGLKRVRRALRKTDTLDSVIEACASSLDLKIDKAWLPAIRAHLHVTLRHGVLVASFALPDDSEPAPVFEP
jgi:hypothetical protein